MQRGSATLFLLLAILLLIAGMLGMIFLQQTFNKLPTSVNRQVSVLPGLKSVEASGEAGLQKYQDPDLNFEFEYSSDHFALKHDTEEDYNIRENGNFRKNFAGYVGYEPGTFVKALAVVNNTDGSFRSAPFTIWVFDNPGNLDANGWFKNYWYYPFEWGQFEIAEKAKLAPDNEATVSGTLVNFGTVAYQNGSPSYYYIPQEGKMFLIRILMDNQKVGQQVLKTLKFHH